MLNTNCEYLRPEIMDVLRLFDCEEEEFTHYCSYTGGKFFNSIEFKGVFYDYEEEYKAEDDIVFKRLLKRACKLAFYKTLEQATKKSLSWGALTGIRPTKLAYAEKAAGRDFKKLFEKLCVSKENTSLIGEILEVQKSFYRRGGCELYVSIPFCPTKCDYCSFITAPIEKTRGFLDEYIDCLIKEINSVKPLLGGLNSIYLGGGTPFVLDTKSLEKIFSALKDLKAEEYTVEAGRPDVFSDEKLRLCKEFGVNRICVNPQSFIDTTLEKIGRKHTADQTLQAYEMAKKYGFDINIDLIAGLADENTEDFCYSLEKAISLSPANITVHTLSLKSGSKLKEDTKRLNISGIGDMVAESRKKLSASGYRPYYLYRQKYQAGGLENVGWCRDNKACIYNIGVMEEISDNIAVGANAISKKLFDEGERIERYAAPKDIPTYIAKVDKIISERKKLFEEGQ